MPLVFANFRSLHRLPGFRVMGDGYGPGGRGESVGTGSVVNMSNKPNFPVFGLKMRVPVENEANPCGREARHWGFGIADWGFGAAGARNAKQTQFPRFWSKNEGRDGKRSQFGGSRLLRRFASRNDTSARGRGSVKQSRFPGAGARNVKQTQFAAFWAQE